MDTLLKNKKAVIVFILLVLAFFLYGAIFVPDASPSDEAAVTPGHEDLLNIANELSSINFRQELFSAPAYRALLDFSTDIPPQPAGRPNPFQIIGRD
jgi:hypothetical protein